MPGQLEEIAAVAEEEELRAREPDAREATEIAIAGAELIGEIGRAHV